MPVLNVKVHHGPKVEQKINVRLMTLLHLRGALARLYKGMKVTISCCLNLTRHNPAAVALNSDTA